ncbi:MAG: single-stranded DNA-binding protein [Bacteroidetes bacterium]|nr:single-stranded DNA-binding protein [Bacteroidota bacterium]
MVNKVFLLGRLGKDPEVKYLDNNRAVANFTLATNEVFLDKTGNKVEQTDWHNIEMWDALAKNAEKVLKKGRTVFIEGKIKNDTWQDKEGNKRSTIRIRALQFQVVNSNNVNPENTNPEKNGNSADGFEETNSDILPF